MPHLLYIVIALVIGAVVGFYMRDTESAYTTGFDEGFHLAKKLFGPHPSERTKPTCLPCGKVFKQQRYLKDHMRRAHKKTT